MICTCMNSGSHFTLCYLSRRCVVMGFFPMHSAATNIPLVRLAIAQTEEPLNDMSVVV